MMANGGAAWAGDFDASFDARKMIALVGASISNWRTKSLREDEICGVALHAAVCSATTEMHRISRASIEGLVIILTCCILDTVDSRRLRLREVESRIFFDLDNNLN